MKNLTVLCLCFAFLAFGCASILNPYESDFQCPNADKGKCASVGEAYNASLDKKKQEGAQDKKDKQEKVDLNAHDKQSDAPTEYQTALYKKISGLLKEPVTPMVAPPPVMRALFLSYPGDGDELFMPRYIYFFLGKPRWVLENITNKYEAEE